MKSGSLEVMFPCQSAPSGGGLYAPEVLPWWVCCQGDQFVEQVLLKGLASALSTMFETPMEVVGDLP